MARVTVRPEELAFVDYDPERIAALTEEVAAAVGLGDPVEIVVDIDEASPFGHIRAVADGGRITIRAESGAFEDPKNLGRLSEPGTRQALARQLFRIADRRSGRFGDAPPEEELTLPQQTAWDASSLGRFERRLGEDGHRERRRYHFRLRHGFTDVADRVFERLWDTDEPTWADLRAACEETASVLRP